jgi:branched-chain amino acid transport system substrate-binding protein
MKGEAVMTKKLTVGIVVILVILALFVGCKKKEEVKAPIKVGAIVAVTGGASWLGAPEAKTLEMLLEETNAAGGIDGHPVELIIKDSQASAEKAISFAKQLIEEEQVLAIIGPSTSGESMAIKDICQEGQTILLSCAAAETIVDPVAPYVFKTPQKDSYAAIWIFKTMQKMGISKIGVVAGNTGFGNGGKAQLEKYAPEYGIEIAIAEVYDSGATDLTGVLTKLKARDVQAVVNWSIVPAQSIVAKNMRQLGMEVPLFQSHGFGNIKYVEAAGEAAEGIIFPCGRLLVADVLPADHPQKKLLVGYKNEYESRYGEEVSTFGGHAYDAFIILKAAIEKAGSIEKTAVRGAIESLKGVVGTAGIFNMSASDHNGLGLDSFEMLTVKDGKFVLFEQ